VCNFVTQKKLKVGETCLQVRTTQKLLLVVTLGDTANPLGWAVGFWQKQKQVKSQPKAT
jgi:hypothetical protein